MYAIVEDGGKQYRVEDGTTIYIERRDLPADARTLEFDRVLMLGDGASSTIGTPCVEGARVTARIDGAVKGPKLEIVKFKRRKGYRRKQGHRQDYTEIQVDSIQ